MHPKSVWHLRIIRIARGTVRFALLAVALCLSPHYALAQRVTPFPPQIGPNDGADSDENGGRVHAITVNPTNSQHVVFANDWGGMWKTEDGGAHWKQINSLNAVNVIDVEYSPDGNVLVATTARDNQVQNGGGIWISRDGGRTWNKPAGSDPPRHARVTSRGSAYGISFAPDDGDRIYVGTDFGVALSTDGGTSWRHFMMPGSPDLSGDSTQNAVGSVQALPQNGGLALAGHGLFRGSGDNWTQVPGVPTGVTRAPHMISALPLNPYVVVILVSYTRMHVYNGSFDQIVDSLTLPDPADSRARGPFVRAGWSDVPGKAEIWVGHGFYPIRARCADLTCVRTLTPGAWETIRSEYHVDSGDMGLDGDKRPVMYGTDGGIYKPTNAQSTVWTRAGTAHAGLNSYQITDLLGTNIALADGGYRSSLYFTTQDNYVWGSPDGGQSWPVWDCMEGFHLEGPVDAARDEDVTIAYGTQPCVPNTHYRMAGANLLNQRDIPNLDEAGNPVDGLSEAFYVAPDKWIRFRDVDDVRDLYTSTNNGNNWRKAASVTLRSGGVPISSRRLDALSIYAPFKSHRTAPNGMQRIGLLRMADPFQAGVRNYGDEDLIMLPDDGSLGMRRTEFDHQAVFGVHPHDSNFIIAPDAVNQVVRVSDNGGEGWRKDTDLTSEVTRAGTLLLYDGDPSRMQVTHISFNPYDDNHILVGTRDAGVIETRTRGESWHTVPGTENILYITGFFFRRDRSVVVATYGRGLWEIRPDVAVTELPNLIACATRNCRIRLTPDFRIPIRPFEWTDKDVIIAAGGHVTGMVLQDGRVVSLSMSPDARLARLTPLTAHLSDVAIDSKGTRGFGKIARQMRTFERKERVNGVVLRDGVLVALLTGETPIPPDRLPVSPAAPKPASSPRSAPYLMLRASVPSAGPVFLHRDLELNIFGRGFASGVAQVEIDGTPFTDVKVGADGTFNLKIELPVALPPGTHTVRVVQAGESGTAVAAAEFFRPSVY